MWRSCVYVKTRSGITRIDEQSDLYVEIMCMC